MKGRVDDLKLLPHCVYAVLTLYLLLHLRVIAVVDLLPYPRKKSLLDRVIHSHSLHRREVRDRSHLSQDARIVRRGNLRPILPVDLVAVVLRRVVAGRNVDAGRAAKMAHREGKHRRGPERLKDISLNAVCREAARCFYGKFR